MNEKCLSGSSFAMLSGLPVMKLSTQMTSCPSARKRSQRCEPMKPAPPVIITLAMRRTLPDGQASDRVVDESERGHVRRLVEVPAVEDDRTLQELLHAREVGPAKLVPLREDEQRIGTVERVVIDR